MNLLKPLVVFLRLTLVQVALAGEAHRKYTFPNSGAVIGYHLPDMWVPLGAGEYDVCVKNVTYRSTDPVVFLFKIQPCTMQKKDEYVFRGEEAEITLPYRATVEITGTVFVKDRSRVHAICNRITKTYQIDDITSVEFFSDHSLHNIVFSFKGDRKSVECTTEEDEPIIQKSTFSLWATLKFFFKYKIRALLSGMVSSRDTRVNADSIDAAVGVQDLDFHGRAQGRTTH